MASFAEFGYGNQEDAAVELVVRRWHVHDGQVTMGIVAHVIYWDIEIPVSIGTEVLESFDLDGNSQERSKTPQIEVDSAIGERMADGRRAAPSGRERDPEEVLSHRPKLRPCELASPIGAVGWIKAYKRVQQSHLQCANQR